MPPKGKRGTSKVKVASAASAAPVTVPLVTSAASQTPTKATPASSVRSASSPSASSARSPQSKMVTTPMKMTSIAGGGSPAATSATPIIRTPSQSRTPVQQGNSVGSAELAPEKKSFPASPKVLRVPANSPVPASSSSLPSRKLPRPSSTPGEEVPGSGADKDTAKAEHVAVETTAKLPKRHRRRTRDTLASSDPTTSGAVAGGRSSTEADFVEHFIRESKVIAPDVSGIRCLAVHPSERELVVARENGSLVRYAITFFQGVPQFVRRRHTGGQSQRTITGLAYVTLPSAQTSAVSPAVHNRLPVSHDVLLASMMSGEIVVYDAELLAPIALHQRSGGAIWALHVVSSECIYVARADGSWQQLRLTCKRDGTVPTLELVRMVSGVSGADRALSVTASVSLRMAVGTDDAGNVHAWRLPVGVSAQSRSAGEGNEGDADAATASGRGLAEHEALWTTRIASGIALSCAVVGGTRRPCVVVGTSMGDVALLDAAHGHVFQTFSQHKGPVTTLVVQGDAVVYASGWHESLRSYRCNTEGEWYPAEVKRRTHYHEASQLALLPHHQLLLSASRDSTIMYAATSQLFHTPAVYLTTTTQQFAYAAQRGLLLQSRFDTIEAFHMDGAGRHWVPFFGHRLAGRFHLSGLWCDPKLDYIVFTTEERLELLKVVWRTNAARAISRIEVVLELPARNGIVDVCWTPEEAQAGWHLSPRGNDTAPAAETTASSAAASQLYVLYDDTVACVTLAEGYPVVNTTIQVRGHQLPGDSLRPYRVLRRPVTPAKKPSAAAANRQRCDEAGDALTEREEELVIYGHRGSCRLRLMMDGTPDVDSLVADLDDTYELVQEVPTLRCESSCHHTSRSSDGARVSQRARTETSTPTSAEPAQLQQTTTLVGLSTTQNRYFVGPVLSSSSAAVTPMPATLPHDVRWIARIASSQKAAAGEAATYRYLGYFSRGLLVSTSNAWHMVRRMSVEAAFVVHGGTEVLVLDRNLEKTLEALPMCWKVRRFGN